MNMRPITLSRPSKNDAISSAIRNTAAIMAAMASGISNNLALASSAALPKALISTMNLAIRGRTNATAAATFPKIISVGPSAANRPKTTRIVFFVVSLRPLKNPIIRRSTPITLMAMGSRNRPNWMPRSFSSCTTIRDWLAKPPCVLAKSPMASRFRSVTICSVARALACCSVRSRRVIRILVALSWTSVSRTAVPNVVLSISRSPRRAFVSASAARAVPPWTFLNEATSPDRATTSFDRLSASSRDRLRPTSRSPVLPSSSWAVVLDRPNALASCLDVRLAFSSIPRKMASNLFWVSSASDATLIMAAPRPSTGSVTRVLMVLPNATARSPMALSRPLILATLLSASASFWSSISNPNWVISSRRVSAAIRFLAWRHALPFRP